MLRDPYRVDGKVALVTESATGIGEAVAVALAAAGADVVCHSKNDSAPATVEEVERQGRRSFGIRADLADRSTHQDLVQEAIARFGRLDILVNNAGLLRRAPPEDHSEGVWDLLLEVNLTAVFRLSRLVGAHMLERGSGRIVNIASLQAFQGGILGPQSPTSTGVASLSKALADAWAARGVMVNAIAPGYIATDNTTALRADARRNREILERIPAGRWGDLSDIARATVFLCGDASRYVNWHVLCVDGGWMDR